MSLEEKIDEKLNELTDSEKKVKQFSDLLESIKELDSKKRVLWKEIYDNAVSDREKAGILFTEAFKCMGGGTADHMSIGPTLVKYLERMCKSNAQIISLADMISKSEEFSSKIDPDDLFSKIVE
tara:strand:+ start:254 stop:625 length:372 start_codon:yes stop_codon:yes gene_type:complete